MKAMILAAGLGTRMQELTRNPPKPLLPVLGIPLIAHTLFLLHRNGCQFAAINTHYLGDQLREYLADFPYFQLQFTTESRILGTGGGIANAILQTDLSGYFWVLNPDCIYLPEFSLNEFYPDSSGSRNPDIPSGIPATEHVRTDSPLLFLTERPPGSPETGLKFMDSRSAETGGPALIQFDRQGKFLYTGLALLHEEQFSDVAPDLESSVVQDWKQRAGSKLLGYPYAGRILDVGRKSDYLEIYKDRNAFPLTYIHELQDFMLRWKGNSTPV